MPYITQEDRIPLDEALNLMIGLAPALTAGQLNYCLTRIVQAWTVGGDGQLSSYLRLATAIGVLETCKLEFYRRLGVPYENQKIAENGDVMPE
jgi:hypothetical protein